MLIAVVNNRHEANRKLFTWAADNLPTIIVDCANYADPHRFYPEISLEAMQEMYVFELELLHRFRDVLRHLPLYAKRLQARSVIVTTSDHLINYRDEQENIDIYQHCWELMKKISVSITVIAAVDRQSGQYKLAQKFCNEIWEDDYGTHRFIAEDGHRHHSARTQSLWPSPSQGGPHAP